MTEHNKLSACITLISVKAAESGEKYFKIINRIHRDLANMHLGLPATCLCLLGVWLMPSISPHSSISVQIKYTHMAWQLPKRFKSPRVKRRRVTKSSGYFYHFYIALPSLPSQRFTRARRCVSSREKKREWVRQRQIESVFVAYGELLVENRSN